MRESDPKPKAGDALILVDGETRALIEEVAKQMVGLSRMVEPIPVARLAPVPGQSNVWRLVDGIGVAKDDFVQ